MYIDDVMPEEQGTDDKDTKSPLKNCKVSTQHNKETSKTKKTTCLGGIHNVQPYICFYEM